MCPTQGIAMLFLQGGCSRQRSAARWVFGGPFGCEENRPSSFRDIEDIFTRVTITAFPAEDLGFGGCKTPKKRAFRRGCA